MSVCGQLIKVNNIQMLFETETCKIYIRTFKNFNLESIANVNVWID